MRSSEAHPKKGKAYGSPGNKNGVLSLLAHHFLGKKGLRLAQKSLACLSVRNLQGNKYSANTVTLSDS